MKLTQFEIIEWFLRLSLSAGFLSAVADRFGLWRKDLSAWGNWDNFIAYTKTLNPLVPQPLISVLGGVATSLEVIFAIVLLTSYKTAFFARCSGYLLLLFALAMTFSKSIKVPLDYSVFCASAASFALGLLITTKRQNAESINYCNRKSSR